MENMSYELRTPLTTIIGFSEMLDNGYFGALTPKQTEYLKGILESSQQLDGLISDLLDLSGIGSGTISLAPTAIDMASFILGFAEEPQKLAKQKNIQFDVDVQSGVGKALVDPRRIAQILTKLLDNAFAFTPRGGTVRLTARGTDTSVIIDITDTGIGISAQDLPHVFERFRRGGNAVNSSGVGLGLALVKHFTELHGGSVTIQSEEKSGTNVQLVLPRTAEAPSAARAA
jgi:signal transduction histidine kinase